MSNLCECGCGTQVTKRFVHGHNGKLQVKLFTSAERSKRWRNNHPEYAAKRAADAKAWYHKNRESVLARRRARWMSPDPTKIRAWRYKRDYGITIEQYNEMFEAQGGKCALCSQPHADAFANRLCVDHDHVTGKVRGLLCRKCNASLERADHVPGWLSKAIKYLAMATVMLLLSVVAQGQTVVNLSVTDTPDNQTWNNGTWSVQLIPGAGSSDQTRNFTLLSGGGSLSSQSGNLSTTGTASFSLPANVNIGPSGTRWQFTVCSQAATACSTANITVTTSSPQSVTISPPSIRIASLPNLPPVVVYTTTEVSSASLGSQITVVGTTPSTPLLQSCTAVSGNACTTWTSAGGVASNSPNPAIPGPPVFNVKNYGAKGDSQATGTTACSFTNGQAQFTCSGTAFSSSTDIGKNLFCSSSNGGASFFGNSLQTIVSVQGAGTATASTTSGFTASGGCVWGTIDDTAISAAVTAAKAAVKSVNGSGNTGIITSSPTVYFPAGGYFVCTLLAAGMVNLGSTVDGFAVLGDGLDQTYLYPGGGTACPNSGNSILGAFFNTASGSTNIHVGKLTIDGVNGQNSQAAPAAAFAGQVHMYDVQIQRWAAGFGLFLSGQADNIERPLVVGGQSVGIECSSCSAEFRGGGSSNNGTNVLVTGVTGSNGSNGFRWYGGLIDECGTNPTACFQVANSQDVWLIGMAGFGTPSAFCLNVDGTSFVHWAGGICGVFGTDNNTGGAKVLAGGILQASDVRFISTGTSNCINNAGIFNDNGGNSCESMFRIASGTSTGTTAVLTLTTAGANVNTNCSVGDALQVEGAVISGYNGYYPAGATSGITATSATTLTYTTAGSNLGALGAGGVAHCRNLQTYTGTLPKALLNNPIPNTCYYTITPIANATAVTLCNFKTGSATNITTIKASSQATTTCATPPLITISDGTVSQTLTLTSGKNSWDSSVDTSTGVGTTIFKPNGTITVKYDVAANSACATPATNLAVSYTISPILSN